MMFSCPAAAFYSNSPGRCAFSRDHAPLVVEDERLLVLAFLEHGTRAQSLTYPVRIWSVGRLPQDAKVIQVTLKLGHDVGE